MIPLVADDFFEPVAIGHHGLHVLGGSNQRLAARRGIAFVGILYRDRHDRARLEIDGMLGLVREMRPTILHLHDLGVGIERMRPVVVRALGLPLTIQARQVFNAVGVSIPDACASRIRNSS